MAIECGYYNHVRITPSTGSFGQLIEGTGTSNQEGTFFYCSTFDVHNMPKVGSIYNIIGIINGSRTTFLANCSNSGSTSGFHVIDHIPNNID